MERKTIILIVSIALVGLFLGEINDVVGNWSWPYSSTPSYTPYCRDSDGGYNPNVKGTVSYRTSSGSMSYYPDVCYSYTSVREYYCTSSTSFTYGLAGCSLGQVCRSGQCVVACTNECTTYGSRQCVGITSYKTCGNFDSDVCLEWSSTFPCASGENCKDGRCAIAPTMEILLETPTPETLTVLPTPETLGGTTTNDTKK